MDNRVEELMKPFPSEDVKKRDGAGRQQFSYVEGENIIERLIEATGGVFDVEVTFGPELVAYTNPRTSQPTAFWQAKVKLTIPGLGSREHIGTALPENEDAPKSAVTDGLKKAATLFGVALQIHESRAGNNSYNRAGVEPSRPNRTEIAPKPKPAPTGAITDDQRRAIIALCNKKGQQPPDMEGWTQQQGGDYLKKLQEKVA